MQLQGRKTITAEDFHNAYLTRQGELTSIHNMDCCCMCAGGGGGGGGGAYFHCTFMLRHQIDYT